MHARSAVIVVVLGGVAACGASAGKAPIGGAGGSQGNGGAPGWDGHIIQRAEVSAVGPFAIGILGPTQVLFRPVIGTQDEDTWRLLPSMSYDATLTEAGATGTAHYGLVRSDDTLTFDLTVDQTTTAVPMDTAAGPDGFNVVVRKPGTTKFRMVVTCTNASTLSTGAGESTLAASWQGAEQKAFCIEESTPGNRTPLTNPDGMMVDVPVASDGHVRFDDLSVAVVASVKGAGDTAHAAVRVSFQFIPVL